MRKLSTLIAVALIAAVATSALADGFAPTTSPRPLPNPFFGVVVDADRDGYSAVTSCTECYILLPEGGMVINLAAIAGVDMDDNDPNTGSLLSNASQ